MYPLIIRSRLLKAHEQPVRLGQYRHEERLPDWVDPLASVEGFRVEQRRGGWYYVHVSGSSPSVREMAAELMADPGAPQSATLELTTLLLSRGETHGTYGDSFNPQCPETLHLLTCGIDWERYSAPNALRWSEWMGTFDEGQSYRDVLGVALHCRCSRSDGSMEAARRWLRPVQLGFGMPSIAEVISALSFNQIERLFGET